MCVYVRVACVLSHVWLCDSLDCSPLGSSVHGIFQASILEWIAISYFRGISPTQGLNACHRGSCIGRWILYHLVPPGKPGVCVERRLTVVPKISSSEKRRTASDTSGILHREKNFCPVGPLEDDDDDSSNNADVSITKLSYLGLS